MICSSVSLSSCGVPCAEFNGYMHSISLHHGVRELSDKCAIAHFALSHPGGLATALEQSIQRRAEVARELNNLQRPTSPCRKLRGSLYFARDLFLQLSSSFVPVDVKVRVGA